MACSRVNFTLTFTGLYVCNVYKRYVYFVECVSFVLGCVARSKANYCNVSSVLIVSIFITGLTSRQGIRVFETLMKNIK